MKFCFLKAEIFDGVLVFLVVWSLVGFFFWCYLVEFLLDTVIITPILAYSLILVLLLFLSFLCFNYHITCCLLRYSPPLFALVFALHTWLSICVSWAEGVVETTSLLWQGRGKAVYWPHSPNLTCGDYTWYVEVVSFEFF